MEAHVSERLAIRSVVEETGRRENYLPKFEEIADGRVCMTDSLKRRLSMLCKDIAFDNMERRVRTLGDKKSGKENEIGFEKWARKDALNDRNSDGFPSVRG
jgi:hypothetical protein